MILREREVLVSELVASMDDWSIEAILEFAKSEYRSNLDMMSDEELLQEIYQDIPV